MTVAGLMRKDRSSGREKASISDAEVPQASGP